MDAESVIKIILDRTTILAADADRAKRSERSLERERDHLKGRLAFAEGERRRLARDMEAAEAKICEWAEYASKLRAIIYGVTPKKNRPVLPDMPGPLETEIPF